MCAGFLSKWAEEVSDAEQTIRQYAHHQWVPLGQVLAGRRLRRAWSGGVLGMHFDIRTLLVAVALATAFCAGARVMLWRMHTDVPGPGHWSLASALGALALVLIAAHGAIPGPLSLPLAQVLIAAGFLVTWDGFRRFVGSRALSSWAWAGAGFVAAVPLLAADVAHSTAVRAAANAVVVAVISALIARELVDAARRGRPAVRATGWLYAANAVFFVIRTFSALQGEVHVGAAEPNALTALPLFWWLCITVAVTLGMALMIGERLLADLDQQASCDPLTGALNRRAFSVMAEKEAARARRHGRPLALLMMDLDHFKRINDHLGHAGGDDILRRFVAAVKRALRTEDVFCRFGGEEFIALLPGTPTGRALAAAERLRTLFAEAGSEFAARVDFPVTVSIGIAALRGDEDIEALIRRADVALYRATENGRNRCELAESDGATTVGDAIPA